MHMQGQSYYTSQHEHLNQIKSPLQIKDPSRDITCNHDRSPPGVTLHARSGRLCSFNTAGLMKSMKLTVPTNTQRMLVV